MAHCNTVLHQMLRFISRHDFSYLEKQHTSGRRPRSFTRWNQFVHLMFMQLTSRASLRDNIESLKVRRENLYHLGAKPVARSTFSDANNKRPASFYEALFQSLFKRCKPLAPKHKFKFKNKLYSLDATVIDLSLGLFPWASFRRKKGAIKLHTLLDHEGYLPAFVSISEGKKHEIKIARSLHLPKGSIVVEDRAYTDYAWFGKLSKNRVFFVTRQKKNATYKVLKRLPVNKKQGITSDQTIRLIGAKSENCPYPLRRIGYRDPETKKHYVFLTNHFKLSAKTIADVYKDRWQIEIFFRWIKQNLKIKSFVGNSKNAVMTQIWVALITYLLLCYLKFLARIQISMQNILRILQLNLFRKCPFTQLFKPPPIKKLDGNKMQLTLNFS
jgi:hypothetical protein